MSNRNNDLSQIHIIDHQRNTKESMPSSETIPIIARIILKVCPKKVSVPIFKIWPISTPNNDVI
jgi:hypothetical protein